MLGIYEHPEFLMSIRLGEERYLDLPNITYKYFGQNQKTIGSGDKDPLASDHRSQEHHEEEAGLRSLEDIIRQELLAEAEKEMMLAEETVKDAISHRKSAQVSVAHSQVDDKDKKVEMAPLLVDDGTGH